MARRNRIYICGADDGTRVVPHPECPASSSHTPRPPGYIQRYEWAESMARTHVQRQCSTCHLWCIWVPKVEA
jgi:hypothetical protein